MTNTLTYNVLDNILYFVSEEIRHAKPLNPDIPILNQFDDVYFDELDFLIALVKFEMDYLVEIPDELCDSRFTFRQLAEAIATLPKIDPANAEEFVINKQKMLRQIAIQMLEEIKKAKKGTAIS